MNGDARNGSGVNASGNVKLLSQSALPSWRLGTTHGGPLECEVTILVRECPQIGSECLQFARRGSAFSVRVGKGCVRNQSFCFFGGLAELHPEADQRGAIDCVRHDGLR